MRHKKDWAVQAAAWLHNFSCEGVAPTSPNWLLQIEPILAAESEDQLVVEQT